MATVIIETKDGTVEFECAIGFDPTDLPYLCPMGYGMNCSSTASPEALDAYWELMGELLASIELDTDGYVTLLTIITEEGRFGI